MSSDSPTKREKEKTAVAFASIVKANGGATPGVGVSVAKVWTGLVALSEENPEIVIPTKGHDRGNIVTMAKCGRVIFSEDDKRYFTNRTIKDMLRSGLITEEQRPRRGRMMKSRVAAMGGAWEYSIDGEEGGTVKIEDGKAILDDKLTIPNVKRVLVLLFFGIVALFALLGLLGFL